MYAVDIFGRSNPIKEMLIDELYEIELLILIQITAIII